MMFYVGIDVARHRHSLAAITERGEKVIERFEFANTADGFERMPAGLFEAKIDRGNSRIALEATGHYGRCITAHLIDAGFDVCEGNPLQTHNFARAESMRKVKNDAVDALALARWLLSKNPAASRLSFSEAADLKSIARFRTFQMQIISDCKRKVLAVSDQLFPEYASHFSDVFGTASKAVLLRYPSARALSRAHIDALTNLLHESSRGRMGHEKAVALRDAAKGSFATNAAVAAQSIELCQLLAQIEFSKKQLADIDKEMRSLLSAAATPITTIPGVGIICGATILGEIGDISRFRRPSSLVAFAGLDPSVFESGKFVGTKNHLSKRGSTYLRWALWIAADRARSFDPAFAAYYAKKRFEGKCHKVAIGAVARKLCNTIFAVLSRNAPYVCPAA
jgi:transposase